MNLDKIIEKLSEIFGNSERRQIVFWYDEKKEFEEEIKTLTLENVKIHVLTGKNYFETKYLLEIQDKDTNYLIYAPFKRPEDSKNSLADIYHYSRAFSADRITLIADEAKIPYALRDTIKKYDKFWNRKERVEKFRAATKILKPENEQNIVLGILAVLCGVKHPRFNTILKKVIADELCGKNKLDEFEKYAIKDDFWKLCTEEYELREDNRSFDKLLKTLLVTDLCQNIQFDESEFPRQWKAYKTEHAENIDNIIKSIRDSKECKDIYGKIAEDFAKELKVSELLKEMPAEAFIGCSTFEYFDERISSYLYDFLITNSRAPEIISRLEQRSSFYYSEKYKPVYDMLTAADNMLRSIEEYEKTMPGAKTPEEFFKAYRDKWYETDTHYRLFCTAYDEINDRSPYSELDKKIVLGYKQWINELNIRWSDLLTKTYDKISDIDLTAQNEFYSKVVKPELDRGITTVVIISDALRYECAEGIREEFRKSQKAMEIDLDVAISNIPTYTKLGMATLLPHKTITMDVKSDFAVRIDGKECNSTESRGKILQKYNPDSAAFAYESIFKKTRDELREDLQGKDLIYIYHNRIDAEGDKAGTESRVFKACGEAISEIISLVMKLTHAVSYTNYIVTADHGFIYKKGDVSESEKIANESDKTVEDPESAYHSKRRYELGTKKTAKDDEMVYSLEYLGKENASIYASVPKATDIYTTRGAGQKYVHGGYSLQECCLPILKIKTKKSKVELEKVSISVTSKNKITNISEFVSFMQIIPCNESTLPLKAKAWFENEKGEIITTNAVEIYADSKEDKNEFREKFTFKKMKYSKNEKYYLVVQDAEKDEELFRVKYTIDIAFTPQF